MNRPRPPSSSFDFPAFWSPAASGFDSCQSAAHGRQYISADWAQRGGLSLGGLAFRIWHFQCCSPGWIPDVTTSLRPILQVKSIQSLEHLFAIPTDCHRDNLGVLPSRSFVFFRSSLCGVRSFFRRDPYIILQSPTPSVLLAWLLLPGNLCSVLNPGIARGQELSILGTAQVHPGDTWVLLVRHQEPVDALLPSLTF